MPVVAVADVPADRRQKKYRHLVRESKHSQQRRRSRQFVDQPELRGGLHPRANEGNELPRNEELKISVLQGAEARGQERDVGLQQLVAESSK